MQGRRNERVLNIRWLHAIAREASAPCPDWRSGNRKELVERFMASVPDRPKVYTTEELRDAPNPGVSLLELYFLSQLAQLPLQESPCPAGALDPAYSSHWLGDSVRTKKFLQGVGDAVRELEKNRKKIRVCDAGCGAIPVLSIYAALCSGKVECTALELNPYSAQIARAIVGALGLSASISVVQADARTYVPAGGIDLLVSETMHSGLTCEPLVQIMSNLSGHVAQGGIILPGKVRVVAALGSARDYATTDRYVLICGAENRFMALDWRTIAEYAPGDRLDTIEALLPTRGFCGRCFAVVASEVQIGARKLGLYDSAITVPQVFRDADGEPVFFNLGGPPATIAVAYAPGERLEEKAVLFPGDAEL